MRQYSSAQLQTKDMDSLIGKHSTKVQQLADLIEYNLTARTYMEGDNLPSINELSRTHNVSRDTVFKAFSLLRDKGIIDSTPGKGYYVTSKRKKILLLLDEYSPFKTTFYTSFIKNLPAAYQVDLWFHQYNQKLFHAILNEAVGKYHYYVVMNFNNDTLFPVLKKIPTSKLLLLDFCNFDKESLSFIGQDFDKGFYEALMKLKERFKKYERNYFVFPKSIKHPKISCYSFLRFCKENGQFGAILEEESAIKVQKGCTYLVIREADVVDIIKQSRIKGLKCGKDFGLIVYNDTPAYEVIDEGITALTVDWDKMGKMAAHYIMDDKVIQEYLPTEIHLRNSL